MHLCKDCKHLSGIHCRHGFEPDTPDYVNGGMRFNPAMGLAQSRIAQDERTHGACKPIAINFEPRK